MTKDYCSMGNVRHIPLAGPGPRPSLLGRTAAAVMVYGLLALGIWKLVELILWSNGHVHLEVK